MVYEQIHMPSKIDDTLSKIDDTKTNDTFQTVSNIFQHCL